MEFYVYILYSKKLDVYYKGFSLDIAQRLLDHNNGKSNFTAKVDDWILVYSNLFLTKREALIEEKRLKKLNRSSLEKIVTF